MWRLRCIIAGLLSTLLAASALAGEIPAPIKKPRDKTGAVITKPTADDVAPSAPKSPAAAPSKNATASPAEEPKPLDGHNAEAVAAKEAKKDAPSKAEAKPLDKHNAEAVAAKEAKKIEQPAANAKPGKEAPAAAKTSTAAATPPAPPPVPKEWSAQEIEEAKAHCTAVLKNIDAVSVPEPSFRDGECGAPAAVRLISIGKSPQVALDPPAVLTCDMVVGLHTWLKQDLQPLAKANLGSEIIKIETMSGYSCRNAYGRKASKLSEHGHANALDIRGFVTAQAKTAYVLEHWGPVQREIIAAKIAAEKAAAALAAANSDKAAANAEKASAQVATKSGAPAAAPASGANVAVNNTQSAPVKGTLIEGLPKAGGAKDIPGGTALGFEAAHLGGPKAKDKLTNLKLVTSVAAAPESPASGGRVSVFLHKAHDAACQIFGTTLGPEANNDHRNHFHVDMAPRKATKICD